MLIRRGVRDEIPDATTLFGEESLPGVSELSNTLKLTV